MWPNDVGTLLHAAFRVSACKLPGSPTPRRRVFMDFTQSLLLIALLIAASAFFSVAEISLAASRRLRLRQLADEGNPRALQVLHVQEQPGYYFTTVQIGMNAIAILGGIVGEGLLSPYLEALLGQWLSPRTATSLAFAGSVAVVTSNPALARTAAAASALSCRRSESSTFLHSPTSRAPA